jgi:hypothetical protein
MRDFMLLLQAVELERLSLENATPAKDAKSFPTITNTYTSSEPSQMESTVVKTNSGSVKPFEQMDQKFMRLPSVSANKKPLRLFPTTPLVKNWNEQSLHQLHDIINKIVPPTHKNNSPSAVPASSYQPAKAFQSEKTDSKWKAMFACLIEYKEEFGDCGKQLVVVKVVCRALWA